VKVGVVICSAVAVLATGGARAAPAPESPPPEAAGASVGVTSYPASFFAHLQPNTALEMILALPGFSLDTGDSVRGFGGAAGNVLIDGDRPAAKSDTLDDILKRIPASQVERIDIIRGGAPGIDMQGKTVIANVIRKNAVARRLTIQALGMLLASGRLDHQLRAEASETLGDVSLEGALIHYQVPDDGLGDGLHTVADAAGGAPQTDAEHALAELRITKATGGMERPLLGGKLSVDGSYTGNNYGSRIYDLSPLAAAQQTEFFRQNQDTSELGVRYERRLGPKLGVELYALQQLGDTSENDHLFTPFDDTLFTLSRRQGESIARAILTSDVTPKLQLRYGAEGDDNWMVSHTNETDQGAVVVVPAANILVTELRGEIFADATWRATSKLTFEAGLRTEASRLQSSGDVSATERFVFPKPRLVVTWTPNASDQLQLRIEREVSQLDFNNFAAQGSLVSGEHAGNPQLTPAQDWVLEASVDHRFWKGGDVSLTLRNFWLAEVIDFAPLCSGAAALAGCVPNNEFDAPANIGSGEQRALLAALTLPTDRLGIANGQIILRGVWRFSRVTDPSTLRPRGVSGLHPFDGEAHFVQGLPGLKSTWGVDVGLAWRQIEYHFNEIDTQRLSATVNVYFEYKPRPDLSLRVEADNLIAHNFVQTRAFFDPFRGAGVGALSAVDTRRTRFGPELAVQVRKVFG